MVDRFKRGASKKRVYLHRTGIVELFKSSSEQPHKKKGVPLPYWCSRALQACRLRKKRVYLYCTGMVDLFKRGASKKKRVYLHRTTGIVELFKSSSEQPHKKKGVPLPYWYRARQVFQRAASGKKRCTFDACYDRGAPLFYFGSQIWEVKTSPKN